MEEDYETGKRKFNKTKANEALKKTKESIEQGLSGLKGSKIKKINQSYLLKLGTEELVAGLFRVLSAEILKSSNPDIEHLNLNNLKALKNNLNETIRSNFTKQIYNTPELDFVEKFDDGLYKSELSRALNELDIEINNIKQRLDNEILSKEKQQAQEELSELQKEFDYLLIGGERQKEELVERIAKKTYDKIKQVLKEQQRELEEIVLKSKNKEEDRKNKERAKVRESKEFIDVCNEIDMQYKELKTAKRVLDEHLEYLRIRSGADTFFKGVLSLGIHSLDKSGKTEELENYYKYVKGKLKTGLYIYRGMMLGEKHSLHDEVFL
jgi:hypothetical protein